MCIRLIVDLYTSPVAFGGSCVERWTSSNDGTIVNSGLAAFPLSLEGQENGGHPEGPYMLKPTSRLSMARSETASHFGCSGKPKRKPSFSAARHPFRLYPDSPIHGGSTAKPWPRRQDRESRGSRRRRRREEARRMPVGADVWGRMRNRDGNP